MILEAIQSPDDLKKLDESELVRLSVEIRDHLLKSVSRTGGHLASNLGVVELTMALHKVYDSPKDKIIWDVGHQGYVHKILTGRCDQMSTLRQHGGISGFLKRHESDHDAFDAGHSSTSISAAIGMALARDAQKRDNHVLAVIGDGAMTGGMALEALNYGADKDLDFTIVLNDNEMSISENVGGMSHYLSKIRMQPSYSKLKGGTRAFFGSIPLVGGGLNRTMHNIKESVKHALIPGALFQDLGYHYFGPIDGHNLTDLIDVFENIRHIKGPKLVHVITQKGKGYMPAMKSPEKYHGVGAFDVQNGVSNNLNSPDTYSKVFGNAMGNLVEKNPELIAITAAMPSGTGLGSFMKKHPSHFLDVGIAEQHAVTMAAGLATEGMKPVVAVYSTFLQRAYDQILHDVCIQNLHVVFAIDRAGLVGNDGETHHGVFDLSYLRHLPNMTVLAPSTSEELTEMLRYAVEEHKGPIAIRYPRGVAKVNNTLAEPVTVPERVLSGTDGMILAVGNMTEVAAQAAEHLSEQGENWSVVNMRTIFPVQEQWLKAQMRKTDRIVTIEDNTVGGAFGEAISRKLLEAGWSGSFIPLGIPEVFVSQGKVEELRAQLGLTPEQIAQNICKGNSESGDEYGKETTTGHVAR